VAHPACCTMGTGPFPGVNYGRGVLLTTHSLLVSRSWKSRAIPLPTLWATTGPVTGTLYLYLDIQRRMFCNSAHLDSSHSARGQLVVLEMVQRILHVMTAWFCAAFNWWLNNHDQKNHTNDYFFTCGSSHILVTVSCHLAHPDAVKCTIFQENTELSNPEHSF